MLSPSYASQFAQLLLAFCTLSTEGLQRLPCVAAACFTPSRLFEWWKRLLASEVSFGADGLHLGLLCSFLGALLPDVLLHLRLQLLRADQTIAGAVEAKKGQLFRHAVSLCWAAYR